jgi:hypothetical protein
MEIINYKEINKGALKSKFDVQIKEWGLTLRDCTLFQKESRTWIGMPSKQYQSKEGTTKSYDVVVFDKNMKQRFDAACLDKIKNNQYQIKQENQQQTNSSLPF